MLSILFCIINSVIANLDIELGKTYYQMLTPWQGDTHYKLFDLKIKEVIQGEDLILVVKPLSALGDPNIFISTTQNEPNENSAEIKCESIGLDICLIENPKATTYHIAVYCEGFCRFSFKAVYQEELQMTNDDDMEFKLVNIWTEVIKINVTQLSDSLYTSPQTMEVQVRIRNFDILQEPFKSFLNKGEKLPTTEENDYIGADTFSGMQKFKLTGVKVGEIYTLVVESQAGSIIEIQTRTYGVIRNIRLGEKIEDVVQEGDFQFYCLNLKNETEAKAFPKNYLNIQLLPYKGYAELYVNFDYQPAFLKDYTWKVQDKVTDDLVITQEDFIKYKIKGHYAYIAVVGNQSNATFELMSQLVDPNYMILELNKPTTGKLEKDKQIQYEFFIKGDKSSTVSVSLKNIIGDADIVMKQCESIWSCKVTDEELAKRQNKVNYQAGSLFMYSDEPGNDIIVFDNQPGKCQQYGNTFQCFYVVLIHPGNQNKADELTYSILVTTKSEIITLRENTPLKQIVGDQLHNNYKFVVDEQDQIKRLMIQITPIQGQPKLYYSQTIIYPTKEQHDLQGVQNVLIFGGRDQKPVESGNYYIGVYGYTASQYIITVMIFRNYGDWNLVGKYPNQYIQLLEGDPLEISTNQQNEVQLFKIDLSQFQDEDVEYHQAVEITLRVIEGDYMLYGFDHPDVNISNAFIKGNNSLILESDSAIYPQYLYIRVEQKPQQSSSLFSYQIFYRISSQPIELVLGNNYQGFITAQESQMFFLNYFKSEDLIITKHIEDHDQSLLSVIAYVKNDNIVMRDTSLSLKSSQLKYEECKTQATDIIKCQIVLFVTSSIDSYFSLIVTREQSIVKLYDSEPVTRLIRDNPDHYTFVVSGNETEIAVFSVSGELNILVSIIEGKAPEHDDFPTGDKDSELQSLRDNEDIGSSLFISKEILDLHQCNQQLCYAAVTIMKIPTENDNKGEYTITRSSSVIPLSEGRSYYGQALTQKMKYFKTSPIPKSEGLMIIVTPFSQGNIILLASRDQMPTIDRFDYNSNTIAGDQLTIEPQKDASPDEKIIYYIGVYSFEDINFAIQINIGNVHFYQLRKKHPFNLILDPNSVAYMNYYHINDKGFKILITNNAMTDYGKPRIDVTTYKEMNEQSKSINQTADKYKWTNVGSYLEIQNKDSKFCQDCYYLILINNTYFENDITVTIVMEGESILLLDNLEQQNILSGVDQTYIFHPDPAGSFFINVTLLYGQNIQVFGNVQNQESKKLTELNQTSAREGFYANETIYINQSLYAESSYPTYEITIKGEKGQIYKIECISDQMALELKVGETQLLKIGSSRTVHLYFVIPITSLKKEKQYSLTVENYGHSEYLRKRSAHHPIVKIQRDAYNNPYYANGYHSYEKVEFQALNETEAILYFEFPDIPGLYIVEITPRENSQLPYYVTLGNSDLNLLVPRLQKFVSSKVGQMRLWELNLLEPSKVFIQARLCGGIVNIFGSSSLESLNKGGYENKIENRFNKQVMGSFVVEKPGPYYLGSKVTKSYFNLPKSTYTLNVFLFKPNTIIPDNHFEPGNGGYIQSFYDDKNITVLFSPIRLEEKSSQDYQITSIIYYLIYEKQSLLDTTPLSQCEIGAKYEYVQVQQRFYQANQALNLTQEIGDDFEQVLFSIHARIFITSNNYESFTLDYYYDTNTIKQQNKNLYLKPKREWTKGGITVLVTILLMAIVFLYIKNRKLRSRFEFTEQNQQQLVRQEQSIEMNYTNMQ